MSSPCGRAFVTEVLRHMHDKKRSQPLRSWRGGCTRYPATSTHLPLLHRFEHVCIPRRISISELVEWVVRKYVSYCHGLLNDYQCKSHTSTQVDFVVCDFSTGTDSTYLSMLCLTASRMPACANQTMPA